MAEEIVIQEIRENILIIKGTVERMDETNNLKLLGVEEKFRVVNDRIIELEDNNKWLWRAVVGAVIGGAVAFFIRK